MWGAWLLALVGCTRAPADDSAEPWDTSVHEDSGDDTETGEVDVADLDPSTLARGAAPCRQPVLVRVTQVLDGDTVHVAHEDGSGSERVRLIGVDTPEIRHGADPAECWGDEAAAYTTALVYGQRGWLTFDGECIDPYDRTLAFFHLGGAPGDFVNERLLRDGQGTVMTIWPNDSLEVRFEQAEAAARAEGLGLWGSCS